MILDSNHILNPKPPWLLWLTTDASRKLATEEVLAELGVTGRVLSGRHMCRKRELFDEFAARLSFPTYFGHNWDALAECLADLEWLHGLAYAVVINGAQEILDEEPPEQLRLFFQLIEGVAAEWAQAVALGEDWDRPAIPFHVLLHDTPEGRRSLESRLGSSIPADISLR
jgi:hypothetical protein